MRELFVVAQTLEIACCCRYLSRYDLIPNRWLLRVRIVSLPELVMQEMSEFLHPKYKSAPVGTKFANFCTAV